MADCSPSALVAAASCLRCVPKLRQVRTYLLCQWANAGSATLCDDSDAQAFITAAGLTDLTQINAVCQLVKDLKAYPAAGTKYWDREILIYPIVGGTDASHKVNLKSPGTFDLLYGSDGMIQSARGMQGKATAASYANTQFAASAWAGSPAISATSLRAFWCLDSDDQASTRYYFGCSNAGNTANRLFARNQSAGSTPMLYAINTVVGIAPFTAPSTLGEFIAQRTGASAVSAGYDGSLLIDSVAAASAGLPDRYIYLLAYNNNNAGGASPANPTPSSPSSARLNGFSLGTPLSQSEWVEYANIWRKYECSLSRGNPTCVNPTIPTITTISPSPVSGIALFGGQLLHVTGTNLNLISGWRMWNGTTEVGINVQVGGTATDVFLDGIDLVFPVAYPPATWDVRGYDASGILRAKLVGQLTIT